MMGLGSSDKFPILLCELFLAVALTLKPRQG